MIEHNVPLASRTSFRIGGPAEHFAEPEHESELQEALGWARGRNLPITFLGNGSNVLISDAGIKGLVVSLRKLNHFELHGTTMIASAGVGLGFAAAIACQQGLAGLEFAYGIPGSLGGAAYMNAGAFGGEMSFVVKAVGFMDLDGNRRTLVADEIGFAYRSSAMQHLSGVIVSVILELQPGVQGEIQARMQDYLQRRRATQPLDYPSAGSVFKRSGEVIPAKLLDEMGLKGLRIGDAEISTKHAGFIVNSGQASARDVLQLIKEIQKRVHNKFGILLEPEVRILGEIA